MYLDIVAPGLPFLPHEPRWTALGKLNAKLRAFEAHVLDVVDVIVTKLKRFSPNDRADIEAMVARGLVPHDALVERFRAAADWYAMDARADQLPRYARNLNQVERDMLGVEETDVSAAG